MVVNPEHQNSIPLKDQRILVTREELSDYSLCEKLSQLGAVVHNYPLISIQAPDSWDSFDKALSQTDKVDWVVFTSKNGVLYTLKRLEELGLSMKVLNSFRIACFPAAEKILLKMKIKPDLVPSHNQSEGLLQEFKKTNPAGLHFWMIQAEEPRSKLQEDLLKMNAVIISSTVYCNRLPKIDFSPLLKLLHKKNLDWIVLASASAVQNLFSIIPRTWNNEWSNSLKVACLGEITARSALNHGLRIDAQPEKQDFQNLIQAIVNNVSNSRNVT